MRRRFSRVRDNLTGKVHVGPQDEYRVYDTVAEVPPACFKDERVVVERFFPERDGEHYVIHNCHFLGDRVTGSCLWSRDPIITQQNIERSEREENQRIDEDDAGHVAGPEPDAREQHYRDPADHVVLDPPPPGH